MPANFPKNEAERIEKDISEAVAILVRSEYDKVYEKHPDLKARLEQLKAEVATASDRVGLVKKLSDLTEEVDMID